MTNNFSVFVVFEPKTPITKVEVREHLNIEHRPTVDVDYDESILVVHGGLEWQISRSGEVWVLLGNERPDWAAHFLPEKFSFASTKVVDERIGFSYTGPMALENWSEAERAWQEERRCEGVAKDLFTALVMLNLVKKDYLHGNFHEQFAREVSLFLVGKSDQVHDAYWSPLHGKRHKAETFLRFVEDNYLFRRLYAGFSERFGFIRRTKIEFCQLLLAARIEADQFGK